MFGRKIRLNKEERFEKFMIVLSGYAYVIFFIIMAYGGAILNMGVMLHNEGRMPVLTECEIDTQTHFSFQDYSEVRLPHFSDIFHTSYFIYSIGDIIIVVSISFLISTNINNKWKIIKFNKRMREKYGKKN
jgi:hypothetical protein